MKMRFKCSVVAVLVGLIGAAAPCLAGYEVVRVASGIRQPVYVTAAPNDPSRLFIVEANSGTTAASSPKIARIRILNLTGPNAGTVESTPFLEIDGITQAEDQGLFNLAFHPNYAENGYFYVNYAIGQDGGTSHVVRYQVSDNNPNVADASSAMQVLKYDKPYYNHSGDWLGFSPSDTAEGKYYLYHTTGDGGQNTDPGNRSQNLGLPYGKVLRFDVGADGEADFYPGDNTKNYGIPVDNPFVDVPGAEPLVWNYGLRNPWRASFDRETGDLYIGNVGADLADEVEFQPYDSPGGINYGWRVKEGTQDNPTNNDPALVGDQNPIFQKDALSLTGGYVYRGPVEELQGQYIFADFLGNYNFGTRQGGSFIYSFNFDTSTDPSTFNGNNVTGYANRTADFIPEVGTINFISSFGEDANGNLYIVDMGNLGTPTPSDNSKGEIYLIQYVPDLPGDYNSDGFVDAADYTVWRDNLGAPAGTLINDPYSGPIGALPIGQEQYDTWVQNFGASLSPESGSTAPEPVALALLIAAAPLGLGARRHRRK